MIEIELQSLVKKIQKAKAESSTIELKAARSGCPTHLYDTLSSFSNQDAGGTIVFGIDEKEDYAVCGVYDAQDLQKRVTEQCNQMRPKVRAVFTLCNIGDKTVVSAEIPSLDVSERPCFYASKGRYKGSYVRVGDADEPMDENEIYGYEAFRKKYEDELRPVERAGIEDFSTVKLMEYKAKLVEGRPNLAKLDNSRILDLMGMTEDGVPTLAGMLVLGEYPQAFLPQLDIIATTLPGTEIGEVGVSGERFVDNQRIDGTLDQQLQGAMDFVRKNIKVSVTITKEGQRVDRPQYPLDAVRELILNALVHRDYSIHTQGMPIQLQIFADRLVVTNPGGLYGRMTVDKLGKAQPDTRNPVIANTMEIMGLTENRYSGIPAVRYLTEAAGLPAPEFESKNGEFRAILRLSKNEDLARNLSRRGTGVFDLPKGIGTSSYLDTQNGGFMTAVQRLQEKDSHRNPEAILEYCHIPRTRKELSGFVGLGSGYTMQRYVNPLVREGKLTLGIPGKPNSSKQTYRTVE
ncbi:putative DNA binding domain-containing protein [Bifidobacterium sp. ESL0728]|uniref:ATP-binding protein n=1 Tax=Bifidobacterium sp. ESL0728 TaxID=2983220 RepID=UPI0023F7B54D|nr:ATP-binding protein [Bifidobacterium sp. ESL0728]WEV59052.1 putative DNA binding domain-containing protein [Bifidobacterium sp. ESL0728]